MSIFTIDITQLNELIKKLKPGDSVLLNDGIYDSISLDINCVGSQKNKITIKAKTPGNLILTGKVNFNIIGQYTTVANIIFRNGGLVNGIQLGGIGNRLTGCDISFNNSDGPIVLMKDQKNRIDHCVLRDFSNAGVWLCLQRDNSDLNYWVVDHNIFKNRSPGSGNGFETIRIGTSGTSLSNSRTIITQNIFENCDGEIEIISSKSCENIIYKNTIKTSMGAITLRHGNRCIVSNNKVTQNNKKDTSGLRVAAGEDHILFSNIVLDSSRYSVLVNSGQTSGIYNLPVKNLQVVNNYSINSGVDYIIGSSSYNVDPFNCIYKYNTTYKNTTNSVFSIKQYANLFFQNNKYYCSNLSKKLEETEEILNPASFDISKINLDNYGCTDNAGLDWLNEPENTEIKTDFELYYNKLKTNIITDLANYLPPDPKSVPNLLSYMCIIS
jgi:poly(beta-D-mannuronate) lyase